MATAAELTLLMRAKDTASGVLKKYGKQMQAVEKQAGKMGKSFKVAAPLLGGGSAGLAGLAISTGFAFNILKENAELAFGTLLKDGGKAKTMIADIETLAKKTPFEFEGLVQASQRMLAFGFAADEVLPMLTTIGDAVSAMGGSSEMISRVTVALGQMRAKGKVSAEEMLQLTEAGIPAWQILAENIEAIDPRMAKALQAGKITQEQVIQRLMKMGEQGKLPATKAIQALMAGMQQRFGGLSEKQARTTSGSAATFMDTLKGLLGDLTEGPFKEVAGWLLTLADVMDKIRDEFKNLPEPIKTFLSWLTTIGVAIVGAGGLIGALGLLSGGFGGVLAILGTVATFIGGALAVALGAILSPIGLIILAVAGLALAWTTNFLGIRDITGTVIAAVGAIVSAGWQYVAGLFSWLVETAGSTLSSGWGYAADLFTWLTTTVISSVSSAWDTVAGLFWSLITNAGSYLSSGWGYAVSLFSWLVEQAKSIVSTGFGAVYGVFAWLIDRASEYTAYGWGLVAGSFQWLANRAGEIIRGGFGAVYGVFAWLYDGVIDYTSYFANILVGWWQWIADRIAAIWSVPAGIIAGAGKLAGGAVGAAQGFVGGLAIPGLATGGLAMSPTLAMIGERGPEAVIPLDQMGQYGGGGAIAVTVNVQGSLFGEDIEDIVVRAIDRARRSGRY